MGEKVEIQIVFLHRTNNFRNCDLQNIWGGGQNGHDTQYLDPGFLASSGLKMTNLLSLAEDSSYVIEMF